MKLIIAIFFTAILGACSSAHRVNGWYPVADIPANKIEGNVIVTAKDFDVVNLDTVSFSDMAIIEGKLRAGKVKKWADATENRIGKRMGFVFNDSVIMAPTINCRIESGSFTINSPDKEHLIIRMNVRQAILMIVCLYLFNGAQLRPELPKNERI